MTGNACQAFGNLLNIGGAADGPSDANVEELARLLQLGVTADSLSQDLCELGLQAG